jgi:hypothetical protein
MAFRPLRERQRWLSTSTVEQHPDEMRSTRAAALLQKKFTVDFLTKKMKVNEGEVPQYYVEHSHEANHYAGRVRHGCRRRVCAAQSE